MIEHVFGKPVERKFTAYENDSPIEVATLSSVTLYSTISDATSELNPIVSMSSYTALASSPFTLSYNLPAISDPNPVADRKAWQFWETIKFKLDSSAGTQTEYRALEVTRAQAGSHYPTATKDELKALFPALASYLSDSRIDDILDLAGIQLKIDLKAVGIEYAKAGNLQETNLALAYLAISMCAESQWVKTNQEAFYVRAQDHRKRYTELLSKVGITYDSDGDGAKDQVKQAKPNFLYMPR